MSTTMMRTREDASSGYVQVMERVGFYRHGRPAQGVIEASDLRVSGNGRIDKRMKYSAVIDPHKLNATAIYELSGSPCIYFTRLDQGEPDAATLARLRKWAWNQGMAPMLWVITPTVVKLYNAYAKPTQTDEIDPDQHLIDVFEQTERGLQQLHNFADRLQIESGAFWQKEKVRQIDRRQRIDVTLLNNLQEAERELEIRGLPPSFAQALLGRSIFISYLQARRMLSREFLQEMFLKESFVDILADKTVTYDLFAWVQKTFNGDLFPLEQQQEDRQIIYEKDIVNEKHLEVVQSLLKGTELRTGQMRLWSPYDFSVIPVEMISSIYEMFVHAENAQIARERSTYYTPVNLVDLVLSEVFKQLPGDANILDMSCGSGVFLVEALRRLVARRIANGERWSREMVRNTLYNQIYGIDISRGAIRIAAFSLYLTALELDPRPRLVEDVRFQPLVDHNLLVADAFDESVELSFATKRFHAIVGNPPWRRHQANRLATEYCEKRNYPLVRRSLDQAFLWRCADFANEKTCIGLILHSRPLFAHTQEALEARAALLERFSPRIVINLSDLRKDGLFPMSDAPATVLIATGHFASNDDLCYFVNAEHSRAFKKHNIIEIGPENIKRIPVHRITSDTDILKIATWGSARDMALIERLRNAFPPLDKFIQDHRWKSGQGFQTASGAKEAPALYGKKWLPSNTMTPYQIDVAHLQPLPRKKMHRPRNIAIYKGPLVITTRGISKKENFFAAFSPEDIVYTEEYYGISIPQEQEHLAHYLNGILNASLATYFLFMTASVWGVERDKVEPNDLLRLPVPLPDEDNRSLVERVIHVETMLRQITDEATRDVLKEQLNKAVFALYNLDDTEQALVQDTINFTIDLRMKREHSRALDRPSLAEVKTYTEQFIAIIQPFLQTLQELTMEADVLDVGRAPLQVVKLSLVPRPGRASPVITSSTQGLEAILRRIADLLPARIADSVYTRRFLQVHTGNDFYVIKPAQRRYWSRSAALNDTDTLLAEQLGQQRV